MSTVGAAPLSALAGFLLGAEELVLLAVVTGAFVVIGYAQCALRLRKARDNWRVTVRLDATDIARLDVRLGELSLGTINAAPFGIAAEVPMGGLDNVPL